jgi:hypothetical protein
MPGDNPLMTAVVRVENAMKSDFHYPPQLPENSRKMTYETNPPSFVGGPRADSRKGIRWKIHCKIKVLGRKMHVFAGGVPAVVAEDGQLLLTELEEAPRARPLRVTPSRWRGASCVPHEMIRYRHV